MSLKMSFQVDTSGIDDLLTKHPQNKRRFMDAVAERAVALMDLSFNTSPDGLSYPRGSGRTHVASQAGFPPNVDSGTLRDSLRWERSGDDREIHGAEYALYLEDSTELNRPFIGPAIEEANQDVPALGKRFLDGGL